MKDVWGNFNENSLIVDESPEETVSEEDMPFEIAADEYVSEPEPDSRPLSERLQGGTASVKSDTSDDYPTFEKGSSLKETLGNLAAYSEKMSAVSPAEDSTGSEAEDTVSESASDDTPVDEDDDTADSTPVVQEDTDTESESGDEPDYKALFEAANKQLETIAAEREEDLQSLRDELAEKDKKISDYENDIWDLKRKLSASEEAEKSLKEAKKQVEDSLHDYNEQLNSAKKEAEEYKAKYDDLAAKSRKDKDQITALQDEISQLKKDVEDANDKTLIAVKNYQNLRTQTFEQKSKPDAFAPVLAELKEYVGQIKDVVEKAENLQSSGENDKIYSQEDFDKEARETFKVLKNALINEMYRKDERSARSQEPVIINIFDKMIG